MDKSKWIWMPHAGHLCVGDECIFHLTTYVGGYIISTLGEYNPDKQCKEIHAQVHDKKWFEENRHLKGDYWKSAYFKRFGYEEIGYGRKYETMVFKAKKSEHKCCPYTMISGNVDFEGYNDAESARKGHLKLCKKWSKKNGN